MVVPGINDIAEDFTPKLIGDLDFNAGKRRAIYGTVAGVVGTVILVYFVFFYNAWERGNKDQLLAMAYQAEQTLSSGKRADAVDQYQKFVDAIGSHELSDSVLISKFQAAQSAISSWRDDQKEEARKAAEAKAQSAQPYYGGNTTTEQPRVGHVKLFLGRNF